MDKSKELDRFISYTKAFVQKKQKKTIVVIWEDDKIITGGSMSVVDYTENQNIFNQLYEFMSHQHEDDFKYVTSRPLFPKLTHEFKKKNVWNYDVARQNLKNIMACLGFGYEGGLRRKYGRAADEPRGWPDSITFSDVSIF